MRVYTNDTDWLAAGGLDELHAILVEQYGEGEDASTEGFRELEPDEILAFFWHGDGSDMGIEAVRVDETEYDSEHTHLIHATAAEWARAHGRGFLASVEW